MTDTTVDSQHAVTAADDNVQSKYSKSGMHVYLLFIHLLSLRLCRILFTVRCKLTCFHIVYIVYRLPKDVFSWLSVFTVI